MAEISFETAMQRLNEISVLMNDENLPLENAIKLYSEASELIVICRAEMDNAQLALKTLFEGQEQA